MKKLLFILSAIFSIIITMPVEAAEYHLTGDHSFKSYMSYTAITKETSPQYQLQAQATTGTYGIRMVEDRYIIAIGTGYAAPVGTKVNVHLDNGVILPCIVGDIKQNIHTDSQNMADKTNGNVVEFVIDPKEIDTDIKRRGDASAKEEFTGNVVMVEVEEI